MEHGASPPSLRGYDSFEVKLGDELRGERATIGKSLLEVQRDLRIKAAYVAAIENCDPDVFPNKGFVAGYVRSYARYLGLDPQEIFERFCAESGFDGVNADLLKGQKAAAGPKTLSGPIRGDRNDPLFRPVMGAHSRPSGFFDDFSVSALGSLMVLVLLIGGLIAGGLHVLRDIQRVEIEPVSQRPAPLAEMSDIVAPGLGAEPVAIDTQTAQTRSLDTDLARLYQPRELAVPIVERRDGPIVEIDPDQRGPRRFATVAGVAEIEGLRSAGLSAGLPLGAPETAVQVREEPETPIITVIVRQPAWVRIFLDDGTVLFEKILEVGEVYTLPTDVEGPRIRAGNAGSVFVGVNASVYGPIGQGTGVAKRISLLPDDVREAFSELAEVPEVMEAALTDSLNLAATPGAE